MNFLIIIFITAILQYFTPWWSVALVPFLVMAWRPTTSIKSFFTGFSAIAILWLGYGLYLHTISEGAMSNRIAQIFSLPNGLLLLLITMILGGLVGGASGMAGALTRQAFDPGS